LFEIGRPRTATTAMATTLTRKASQFLELYALPFILGSPSIDV
jgi:hypothetical protein